MFQVTASILKDFAAKEDKGSLGFTTVLHTHNRKRDLHPHFHILVPSGRYDFNKKQWHKGNGDYLFNAFALAKVWRDRMLDVVIVDEVSQLRTELIQLLLGSKHIKNTGNKTMRKVAVFLCPCCHYEMQFAGINRLR